MRSLLCLLIFGACSDKVEESAVTETADTQDTAKVWPPPTVAITQPAPGQQLKGDTVEARLQLGGFVLDIQAVSRVGPPLRWLALAPMLTWAHEPTERPTGVVSWSLDGLEIERTATDSYTFTDVAPGEHELEVELLWSDGDAFYPAVTDDVVFTLQ